MVKLILALVVAWAGSAFVPPAMAQTAARPRPVASDPVTEKNLSKDTLKAAYEAAKLPVSIDGDGDIMIKDRVTLFAFPNKDRIRLVVYYAFKPEATMAQKLALANRVNLDFIMARAAVGRRDEGQMEMDYYVMLGAGVSRATIVAITKRFVAVVADAVKESDKEDIVK